MAFRPKGKLTIKAAKEYKAGDEIEVSGEFEVDQADLDRMVSERMARELEKRTKLEGEIEANKKQIKELEDKAGKAATPDEATKKAQEATAKEIAELKKANAETAEKLARKELNEKVGVQLSALGSKLTSAYRNGINLPVDASDEDIAAAVKKADDSFKADIESLGLKPAESTASKGNQDGGKGGGFGFVGTGGAPRPKGDEAAGKAALDKARKNAPQLLAFISTKNDAEQQKAALAWDQAGQLEPKAAA